MISDPVAFIRKGSKTDGFSRVVIFTEEKAGHFKSNDLFHAVQVNRIAARGGGGGLMVLVFIKLLQIL